MQNPKNEIIILYAFLVAQFMKYFIAASKTGNDKELM